MDDQLLKQFFDQEHMRVEVYRFFKAEMDKLALEKMYRGEDVSGIKEAHEVLVRAERELQTKFTHKPVKKDTRRAE